jgi:eukaryotic-like serine/threonine-protein kinase
MTALPLPPGALVALRYRIGDVLGAGGMGTVFRADHLGLGRAVALKIVPPGLGDASATIRFEREARNAARLDHPGCVRVLDVGATPDGHRFLAMDLLDGPTLRAHLAAGGLAVAEAVRIAVALLDALAHAHERGVIHRDVKPENVMLVGAERRPVLIDFGLSWALGDARVTRRGTTVGSPSYLAPERALGEDGDHRADVYAVGVILYEMLAGQRPFAAPTALELAWMHAHREAPLLPVARPGISLALASIVHRALAKAPAARFASAAAMRAALAGLPVLVAAPPLGDLPSAAEPSASDESTAIVVERRSRLRDLAGRLRFGRWRW